MKYFQSLLTHWSTYAAPIGLVISFLTPSINEFIKANPHGVAAVLLGAVLVAFHTESPSSKAAASSGGSSVKIVTLFLLSLCLLGMSHSASAQTVPAPAALPGYQVSFTAGYSLLTGAQNNNGFFSSVAVPLRTWNKNYSFSVAGRGDYFSIVSPNTFVVTAGPEFRGQFSRASFLNGKVFQPFVNVGAGAARSSSTTSIAGSGGSFAAFKVGGGLDMIQNATITWRLAEFDYIHSKIFPNSYVVLSNWAELETGLGIRF